MKQYKKALAMVLCAATFAMPIAAFADQSSELLAPAAQQQTIEWQLALGEIAVEEAAAPDTETAEQEEAPLQDNAAAALSDPEGALVSYNGQILDLDVYARGIEGVTYVPVRGFFEALGCTVTWNQTTKTATVTRGEELEAVFKLNDRLAKANGRCWYMDQPCKVVRGNTMIPVRAAAKIFAADVFWDSVNRTAVLSNGTLIQSGEAFYAPEDLLWLARIVYHEAGNQLRDGKVAVANVVLNRMNSSMFPNTVHDVIYDHSCGVQFLKYSDQKIYRAPTEECWLAAKLAMEGYVTAPDCLYFTGVKYAKTCWAASHRTFFGTIGDHAFYQ